jgi:hypothetical protein
VSAPPSIVEPQTRRLRVASWNIDARQHGLADRLALLAELEVDVALLQEVRRCDRATLENAPGFTSRLMSLPAAGRPLVIGTAVLLGSRVGHGDPRKIEDRRFIEAGERAGLSEEEVRGRLGAINRNLAVPITLDGADLTVCSFHARPATGQSRPGRPPLGLARQIFHRVVAAWVAEQPGTLLFGVDANSPFLDHPDPDRWRPVMAGDADLIGPAPAHHLRDALYRWLDDAPDRWEAIRAARPDGPLEVSFVRRAGRRARYDHLFVTDDVHVERIDYRQPYADGSDHSLIVADLRLTAE